MTTTKKKTDNMELWNKVCKTDPSMTKQVSQRGGFTAIAAQYQMQLATEQWGPYGGAWVVSEMDWAMYDGELILDALFEYPGGQFRMAVDMPYRAGNECRKKLLTDFTTKALSKLGFNADVFMGMYDDNKYVAELKKEKASSKPKAAPKQSQDESEMSAGQLLKKAKSEVFKLASELLRVDNNDEIVKYIKETAGTLKADLESFDDVHKVKAEIENLIKTRNNVASMTGGNHD